MGRELCKFFAGLVAGLAYMHAMLGVNASRGTLTEPVWLGTKWGAGYMWTEAAFYLGISLALAYFGWFRKKPHKEVRVSSPSVASAGEQPTKTQEENN